MFFIGIAVHKKQSQVCILTEQGELRLEMRVLTMRADLSDVLGSYLPARIVLESSTPHQTTDPSQAAHHHRLVPTTS